ncbi:hypothetical protein O9G_003888 [Rozella allomycis CSF55]|uniref:Dynein regulatory complex subunit 2 n=1 Tax=Rozella allomycis (strain CSF55) TaxID=988480 RepID=A0A075B063_ROZAC|nr:hypothetical protein O9G_003888 [Rozella allomycis CSF55]|eukprot:EPZ35973.1 hypothetical protein O9G_003888 [Rozella allomycis CSF55]
MGKKKTSAKKDKNSNSSDKRDIIEASLHEFKQCTFGRKELSSQRHQNSREVAKYYEAAELKSGISILEASFSQQLDRKNELVKSLKKDIEESEEQYQVSIRTHMSNIENLISMHASRTGKVDVAFEEEVKDMCNNFESEIIRIRQDFINEKVGLLGIIHRMEHEFTEAENESKHDFQSIREDIRNKNLEEKHALRIQLEGIIEDLWRQFQAVRGLDVFESHGQLTIRDSQSTKIIDQQLKKLQKIQYEEKTLTLKEEKEAIQNQFQYLKQRMMNYRDLERKKLIDMARLAKEIHSAEKIIKLTEMNKKLETESELIAISNKHFETTFSRDVPNDNDVFFEAEGDSTYISGAQRLSFFYNRMNKAVLDKMQLESQKKELLQENNSLKSLLKQYLEGVSVNDNVLRNKNSLFIINEKINVNLHTINQIKSKKMVTCIDGNLAAKLYS